jgi:hypothetical protein
MPKPDDRTPYQLVEGKIVGQMMQTDDQWGLYDLDRNLIGRPFRHDASRSLRDLR